MFLVHDEPAFLVSVHLLLLVYNLARFMQYLFMWGLSLKLKILSPLSPLESTSELSWPAMQTRCFPLQEFSNIQRAQATQKAAYIGGMMQLAGRIQLFD